MPNPIRVLLVDDYLMLRRGLAAVLLAFDDLLVVGEARNGAEALDLCATTRPDVVLMDLFMPEVDGVEATRAIRERYPDIDVIVLTNSDEYDLVQRALTAGAAGYLVKSIGAGALAAAIRETQSGRLPRALEAGEFVGQIDLMHGGAPLEFSEELTDREYEVLALLVQGWTNKRIGARLHISPATVKFHVSSILGKLGVTNRTEAATLAVQTQLTNGSD